MRISGMPRGLWFVLRPDYSRRLQDQISRRSDIIKRFITYNPGFMIITPQEMYAITKHTNLDSNMIHLNIRPYLSIPSIVTTRAMVNFNEEGHRTFFIEVSSPQMQVMRLRIAALFSLPKAVYDPKGPLYYIALGYEGYYGRQSSIPTQTLEGIILP